MIPRMHKTDSTDAEHVATGSHPETISFAILDVFVTESKTLQDEFKLRCLLQGLATYLFIVR